MLRSADTRRSVLQTALKLCLSDVPRERVGVDVVHIPTWRRHLELGGQALLDRIYTAGEVSFAAGRPERLATRLAAKEAVLKLLGTGIRGVSLREVEVVSLATGQPVVRLLGRARSQALETGTANIAISLCHEDEFAVAVAVSDPSAAKGGSE